MGVLHDRGDRAGHPDAVAAHRDGDELAALVEHLEAERVGELAAQLEDVAHLDATGELERSGPVRGRVTGTHTGGLDGAVGGEVTAGDQPEAIAGLVEGVQSGLNQQVLLGVTGSGQDQRHGLGGGTAPAARARTQPQQDARRTAVRRVQAPAP